ncbi:coiled-coil domain-containing protein [Lasius niger]|uniref:Coiled-coil domain-containing protein n=1 Tax=Lasius niger TaxID=67767 RepID=A0A0J7NY44_LASNI|nr:coiled-coil domain-containing protein [Lasius niger]
MVQFDEVNKIMDEMMRVTIFKPSEKRRMLEDERKAFPDPNLIMDARHRIFRENFTSFQTKSSILAEARKLLTEEEMRELQLKKEQAFMERELRKFEQDLQKSRPKFYGPCSRKTIASSNDENFWRTSSRVKRALINERRSKTAERKGTVVEKKIKQAFAEVSSVESKDAKRCSMNEIEGVSFGKIKVTIRDKPSYESEGHRLNVLRSCFETLRENARNKRRLREIKTDIQSIASRRNLRSCIRVWRTHVEKAKSRRERAAENSDVRKIEILIDTITETQKDMTKFQRTESKGFLPNPRDTEVRKKTPARPFVIESPAQSRLNAQKEIIHKQRMKLAEQSKIIEELKLKQVQEEIMRAGEETVNAAKETLTHCGQQTRRTLIQLMRQAGYRDKSLTAPVRVPSPPRFLVRMEARAEARRNRIKLREEARQKKLEDEKRKVEAARREEEQERRRSQQEALREAKRMREEREQQRMCEMERCKKLNAMAEEFYRKHLLRRYIMEPFIALVEMKNNYINKAEDHYKRCLLQKAFVRWKMETERQSQFKTELAVSLYNRNLLWYALQKWKEMAREERRKEQVAKDFSDMRLQNKCFKLWKIKTVEYKAEQLKTERLALEHYEERLKARYFNMWKRYPKIVPDILESERIKNTWREIVQEVVPDFDPRQRGVILED